MTIREPAWMSEYLFGVSDGKNVMTASGTQRAPITAATARENQANRQRSTAQRRVRRPKGYEGLAHKSLDAILRLATLLARGSAQDYAMASADTDVDLPNRHYIDTSRLGGDAPIGET